MPGDNDQIDQQTDIQSELRDLKHKRGSIKANITRCRTYLSKLDLQNVSKRCFLELQRRLTNLNPIIHDFNSVQEKIEFLTDNAETEQSERDNFESDYYDICSTIEEILEKRPEQNKTQSIVSNDNVTLKVQPSQIQLPTLNLETFNGDYNKWIEFRDCFQAIVGNNATLSGVEKLCHLRKCLNRDVLKTIESLPLTDANYEIAWQALSKRYEKGKRIVETHVRKIINFPCLTRESSKDLRNLYDTINNNLQALQILGQAVDTWDAILVPIITDKLDQKSKREYESFYIQQIDRNPSDNSSPSVKSLLDIINKRCDLLESLEKDKSELVRPAIKSTRNDHKYQSASSSHLNTSTFSCYFCKRDHTIYKCVDFLKLSVPNRIQEIKRLKYCLNCLRPHDSSITKCLEVKCKKCNRAHNTLLHLKKFVNTTKQEETANELQRTNALADIQTIPDPEITSSSALVKSCVDDNFREKSVSLFIGSQVLLSTAIIFVQDYEGQLHQCRVLLDSGSMMNFIREEFFNKLKLEKISINHSITGVGRVSSTVRFKTNVIISARDNTYQAKLSCLILPQITSNIPQISFKKDYFEFPNNVNLADPDFNISRPVDILLGAGIFWELIKSEKLQIKNSRLILKSSKLGWLVSGEISNKLPFKSINCLNTINLDAQIKKFWEIEEIISKNFYSESETFCENHFLETFIRDDNGRFIVKIPLKPNHNELGNSKEFALKRFISLEKRLLNNKPLYNEYVNFMEEYKSMNHMKEIFLSQTDEELNYYIPHHAVVRESSCTTKVRVVFDASMKTTSGLSLNDVQHVGPTIQNDLFTIIIQFRLFEFVVTADISKMYRMVQIHNDHRPLQRIFWRNCPSDEIKCYELCTVTYSTASAPFLAIRCLHQLAIEHQKQYPAASNAIMNNFYVDDFLYGSDSEFEILDIQRDIMTILGSAGMHLRKWLCNKPDLTDKFKINKELPVSILNIAENESSKTLGISWNSTNDTILYESSLSDFNKNELTKRSILSQVAQIFDPLGLLGPIIIITKILIQKLWQENLGWNDNIPDNLQLQWRQFYESLIHLKDIKIPRHVTISNRVYLELHGFGDASENAYGACVYIRTKCDNGSYISRLLCAKSRVAPLKRLTLPRLELSSAHLLSQLIDKTKKAININVDRIFLWSDSSITLSWIRATPSKWKTFVANRVSEIQRLTNIEDWNHVSSNENPADLISRGTTTSKLKNCELWWTGPSWLSQVQLPVTEIILSTDEVPEQKIVTNTVVNSEFDLISKFSKLSKLQRVTAYCVRFISNCKIKNNVFRASGALSVNEMKTALNKLIAIAQRESLSKDYFNLSNKKFIPRKSKSLTLNPFMDENNLIRVGGRLKNSLYTYDKKFPIILPSDHILTKLILKNEHDRLLHCGYSTLLSFIRERFWPIRGRYLSKGVVRNCITCFKAKPRTPEYLMGNLPKSRITASPPFYNVGLDYAGPFLLKDRTTKNAKLVKGYICLFICLVTKAIHLELVSDLSTECFLTALRRFIGRRGKPLNIYSDNAKNFVGTSNQLKEMFKFLSNNADAIRDELSSQNISWHFIPARTPSFGGIWEAGIKNVKSHLTRILGNANLVYEDFLTILIQIEAVVNSRPLCPISTDPDIIPLTPGHFLIGRNLTGLPDSDFKDLPENRLKKYERLQKLVQHFWVRWYKEYLSELQIRTKWKYSDIDNNYIKVGKVVLVKEDNFPPMQWPLGVIMELHPGKDEITRVVSVKVRGQVLKRGVTKICVLPEE